MKAILKRFYNFYATCGFKFYYGVTDKPGERLIQNHRVMFVKFIYDMHHS